METKFNRLKEKFAEVSDINSASNILQWDQEVYMPAGSAQARAEALSTLSRISHEKFTSPEMGGLIEEVSPWALSKGPDSDEAGTLRALKRDHDRAVKLTPEFVAEFSKTVSLAMEAWQGAKAKSDFQAFKPHLEKIVDLSRKKAAMLGCAKNPYDALLDEFEPGMTKLQVEKAFSELREGLVPVVAKIIENKSRVSNKILSRALNEEKQFDFVREITKALGYDLTRGRQDKSAHPFTTTFSINDVRITTRIQKKWFPGALYASIHECGHALYDQGVDQSYERTPLSGGTSLGIHESQSRMWENLVGRSSPFCSWLLPRLKKEFPSQFSKVETEEFYRAVNKSGPSLIRIESDEATYNLHVLLRFEIESALLEGNLKVEDAPAAWNEKMKKYLGVRPKNDAEGILQDIHWSCGSIGYFPTYTLGNLVSVQLFNKALSEIPGLYSGFEKGDFKPLLDWLRKNIHVHGRKYTANELLKRTVNDTLKVQPFISYIENKYSEIYGFQKVIR